MGYARPYARSARRRSPVGLSGLEIPALSMTGPQPPILPLVVSPHGYYNSVRSSPSDGACGVHGYPCKHPGLDVGGAQGTIVRAPEDGTIVMIADGSAPPWEGYGPYLVVIQGKSGVFHLLAHLQPGSVSLGVGARVTAGQAIATTSSANHTHWEVRKRAVPDFAHGEDNFTNNLDPLQWLAKVRGGLSPLLVVGGAIALALYLRKRRR